MDRAFKPILNPTYDELWNHITDFQLIIEAEKEFKNRAVKDAELAGFYREGDIIIMPSRGLATFVGDLHGDYEALVSIVAQCSFLERMERKQNVFLVFLGDYGDRGRKIIETINAVLLLKTVFPRNVVVLGGNHETDDVGRRYGTHEAFLERYGTKWGESLFKHYCKVMGELPVVALAPKKIIALHGGIPNEDIKSLDDLSSGIYREDILWNDPTETVEERISNQRGWGFKSFGQKAFERFMDTVSVPLMVRSHEHPSGGVKLMFNNRLATIFSNGSVKSDSSDYKNKVKSPVFLRINLGQENKTEFKKSDFTEITYGYTQESDFK